MKQWFFILMVLSGSVMACQSQNNNDGASTKTGTFEVLSVDDFKAQIAKGNVQLVDVRTPQEYASGTIGDAVNIDYLNGDFAQQIQKLNKNLPVYIFCRSGNRSSKAGQMMRELGFKQVYDLRGGYLAWSAQH